MTQVKKIIFSIMLISAILFIMVPYIRAAKMANVHNEMDCQRCHTGEVSFKNAPTTVELKDANTTRLCLVCHEDIISVHHPLRVQVTGDVPDYLPIGEGNSITCTTCHDIHETDMSSRLVRTSDIGNYTSKIDICYECHKDDFKRISPHKSEKEGLSCLVCHRDSPTIKDTRETVTLVNKNVAKICNFCHIVNADAHPLNVDTSIKLSDNLPRSDKGQVVCITCHDPHGTIDTINFLRKDYIFGLELGKYENPHNVSEYFECMKCHVDIPKVKEYTNCRYEDDFILLCYNCHGADAEQCHTVNVELADGMTLPKGFLLNDDGLMTCVTCHSPDCSDSNRIRYINIKALEEKRCGDCHDFAAEYEMVDPHEDGTEAITDNCYVCHKKDLAMDDFGMSEKFICLKCHPYKEHPPKNRGGFTLSKALEGVTLDNKGKITCSTCHDPHTTDTKNFKLITVDGITICEVCHQS